MIRKILFTNLMIVFYTFSYGQKTTIICDSISAPVTCFQLDHMQDSLYITINYTGPNSGVQGGYIYHKVALDDTSVISAITIPPFSQQKLTTYLYATQTMYLKLSYNSTTIPPNYSVTGKYRINIGPLGSCENHYIPITITFKDSTSIDK